MSRPRAPVSRSSRQPWNKLSESQHLECYEGAALLLDDLYLLGHLDFKDALAHSIGPAQHAKTLELSLCLRGKITWNVGGEVVSMAAGDILLTPPGLVHWGEDSHFPPVEVSWLRVKKEFAFLKGKAREDARSWCSNRRALLLRAEGEVEHAFRILLREHRKPDDFSGAICLAALQQLFLSVARALAARPSAPSSLRPLPPKLRQALDVLDQQLETVLPMEELAGKVGCAPDRLRGFFRTHLGLTPLEYQNAQRVAKARAMLVAGRTTVTQIAHELGFSSSQYFSTFFHKHVGVSPRDFRSGPPSVPGDVVVDS